ncbi:N-acetylmuramoyl-L-alanine amidase [Promicromonospora sp. MS192]|uniref:N-acetylmuramoyl-L-alanine amidase n=1 Tax=Promicromonospora sp. MS192 TaxID=3412684 RepID=UPI003C301C79
MSGDGRTFGRYVTSAALTAGLALGGLVLPVVLLPVQAASPVSPEIESVRLTRVDPAARAEPSADDPPVGHAHDESGDAAPRATERSTGTEATRPETAGPDAADPAPPGHLAALTARTATRDFLVAGVTWDGATGETVTDVALRVREAGRWSAWQELGVEEAQVPGSRAGTEPFVTSGADAVQARAATVSGRPPSGMRVDVIDPGSSPADRNVGAAAGPAASAAAATGWEPKPPVVSRRMWGADESLGSPWPETSGTLKAIYVHHTAGTNTYSSDQSAAIVRGIHAYHTRSNGWPDIGYQFLVDRYGRVFEGRREAQLHNPIGAQAGGYNTGTIGVSAMGNFVTAEPTAALVRGLERVLAWKSFEYGVHPTQTTRLRTGQGTSTAKAAPGTVVTVPTILGHRHTNRTACPGDRLNARLPALRSAVHDRVLAEYRRHGAVRLPASPRPHAVSSLRTPVQWRPETAFAWDAVRGAVRYEVLRRSGHFTSTRPYDPYWYEFASTTRTATTVYTPPGENAVYGVRAVMANGRRSPVRVITTTTRDVLHDDWDVYGWQRISRSGYYNGHAYRTTAAGQDIKVYAARNITRVHVMAPTGRGWGRVAVYVGGTRYGVLDLSSATHRDQRVFQVDLGGARSGRVVLRSLDSGKEVRVSGIGVVRP